MGRNNHHAGMHFIHFNNYGNYDDLEYYDRLVAQKEKEKQELIARKLEAIEREKQEAALRATDKIAAAVKSNNNLDNKTGQRTDLIEDSCFRKCAEIYANIFLIAFEKKLDISNLISECEYIMSNDRTLKTRSLFGMTPIESSYIFLQLLSEKMECMVSEFYVTDKESRKQRVYSVLKKITEDYSKLSYVQGIASFTQFIGQDEYGVSNFGGKYRDVKITRLSISKFYYLDIKLQSVEDIPECNMEYYIDKVEDMKEKYTRYFLVVGTRTKNYEQPYEYMYGGSVVHSEKTGQMKRFFEGMLERYLLQGAEVELY